MFIMQMATPLSHGLMTMDGLFFRLSNVVIFVNIRLL